MKRIILCLLLCGGIFLLSAGCMAVRAVGPKAEDVDVKVYNAEGEVDETVNSTETKTNGRRR